MVKKFYLEGTLSGTTVPGQSKVGSKGNNGVVNIPQN